MNEELEKLRVELKQQKQQLNRTSSEISKLYSEKYAQMDAIAGYAISDTGYAMNSVDDEYVTLITKEEFDEVNKKTLASLMDRNYESS